MSAGRPERFANLTRIGFCNFNVKKDGFEKPLCVSFKKQTAQKDAHFPAKELPRDFLETLNHVDEMGYAITLLIGVMFFVLSLVMFNQSVQFLRTGSRATATVIRLESSSSKKRSSVYPIFSFRTLTNQEITYIHNVSSSPPAWKIGEQTTVVYELNNPNNLKLLTYFGAFGWAIGLMAVAMPLLVIGGGYYLLQSFLK